MSETKPSNPMAYITKTVGLATVKELMDLKKVDETSYKQLREYAEAEMKVLGLPIAER